MPARMEWRRRLGNIHLMAWGASIGNHESQGWVAYLDARLGEAADVDLRWRSCCGRCGSWARQRRLRWSWARSWDVDERPNGARGNVGSALERWVAEVVGRCFVGFSAKCGLHGQWGGRRKMLEVMVRSWGGELVL